MVLTLLFLIAATVLNIGLSVLFGFGTFFDRITEELNTSDTYFVISESLYTDEVEQFFHDESSEFETGRAVLLTPRLFWDGEMQDWALVLRDMEAPAYLSQWTLLGDSLPQTEDAIYLPYLFRVSGGYELGHEIILEIEGIAHSFSIAGFSENIYSDQMLGLPLTVFVPAMRFAEFADTFPESRAVVIFANGIENPVEIEYKLLEMTGVSVRAFDMSSLVFGVDLERVRTNRTSMAAMMSTMMIVFTAVIVAVSLLVVRFRIKDSIEDDMPKIGSLQAIGYTSRQITQSFVLQYGLIAFLSCLVSTVPAHLLLPLVSRVFAVQSGLNWQPDFAPVQSLAALIALTGIVSAAAWLAARKIRRISPVLALRGGLTTHSFKRNPLPLDKTWLPRTAALAFKSVLQGARQSIMMFVILTAISFTAVIAVILYYNAAVNLATFEQVPGIERANAAIIFRPGQDADALKEDVITHVDVRDAQYLDMGRIVVGDTHVSAIVMDDYARRVTRNVYQGIFPRYDNEIAISGVLARVLDKGIGDEVPVGPEHTPFLITGLTQGMEHGDTFGVYLTRDGINRIDPDFIRIALMVYLYPGVDAAMFVLEMEEIYREQALFVGDSDAGFAEGVSAFASIVSLVGLVILIISGLVVVLVLYFVIGSTIVRRYRELGIQKALGFTTGNLMSQISLAFALPIVFGSAAGGLLGMATLNPIMSIGMAPMGVMNTNYIINASWTVAAVVLIVMLAYLVSIFVTWRIRKISAYALVTE